MLSRKEIMLLTDQGKAFEAIAKHDDWSNHDKNGAKNQWKKKHVPDTIKKVPNRGNRHNKKEDVPKQEKKQKPATKKQVKQQKIELPPQILTKKVEVEVEDPCQVCGQSSDLYDFPCGHFICPSCFEKADNEKNGRLTCQVCDRLFIFDRVLED